MKFLSVFKYFNLTSFSDGKGFFLTRCFLYCSNTQLNGAFKRKNDIVRNYREVRLVTALCCDDDNCYYPIFIYILLCNTLIKLWESIKSLGLGVVGVKRQKAIFQKTFLKIIMEK